MSAPDKNDSPIIIIGAGRSGTNILRDSLTRHHDLTTWPCDEINLIWRHGNIEKPDDVFTAADARPEVSSYIRKSFRDIARRENNAQVVEKTCANSLRVPFVDAIFPQARFIYIVRDGRDVVFSAAKRWRASIEMGYLVKKLRYVPLSDIPHYGMRFVANRFHQAFSKDSRQASWGPRFEGFDDWVSDRPLLDICAKQWASCVDESDRAFAAIAPERVHKLSYENLARNTRDELQRLEAFLGRDILAGLSGDADGLVHERSVGGWVKRESELSENVVELMLPTLSRHGYDAAH